MPFGVAIQSIFVDIQDGLIRGVSLNLHCSIVIIHMIYCFQCSSGCSIFKSVWLICPCYKKKTFQQLCSIDHPSIQWAGRGQYLVHVMFVVVFCMFCLFIGLSRPRVVSVTFSDIYNLTTMRCSILVFARRNDPKVQNVAKIQPK